MGIKVIHHPWKIIQNYWDKEQQEDAEAIFSLGNGKMGHRGNLEEFFSGPTLQGTYISGIYYPDKTKVGWWKIGYPDYFAKIANAPDWRGVKLWVNGKRLDLYKLEISDFYRELNMKHGYLYKSFIATFPSGEKVFVESTRFLSIVHDELGLIKYSFRPINFSGEFILLLDLNADVKNRDANYGDRFWSVLEQGFDPVPFVVSETKKTFFQVVNAFDYELEIDGEKVENLSRQFINKPMYVGLQIFLNLNQGQTVTVYKYASVTSSLYYPKGQKLKEAAFKNLEEAKSLGFGFLMQEQKAAWERKWKDSDIVIEGDVPAQQGIRFNIFQLNQTYTGKDPRLNIGPKGFTGEKYGGVTYWDTEAFALYFYLSTAPRDVARNLVIYRYKHLPKAIENAQKLGFSGGAALYPMVTINGEECHNEWEITFEEIHRNGAIAYAIYNYVRYNDEPEYLAKYGLEVLIAISRFWAQRFSWSEPKQKYVMLGVTGPNEYENNVNNNWYTSYIAIWTLKYTLHVLDYVKHYHPDDYQRVIEKTNFDYFNETEKWNHIIQNVYFPYDSQRRIYLQQEGFLDKEIKPASSIPPEQRPINQHWSWDRILRSCFIKQADVIQGMFFFEDDFDLDTIKRHFYFYEPLTVHESSLSPSVYSIVASKIGDEKKAYELYLRTARLDLDDYNKEVKEGLHITSMAGTWMSVVYGFGGMRIKDNKISFAPFVPDNWKSFSFKVRFRSWLLKVWASRDKVMITNQSRTPIELYIYDTLYTVDSQATIDLEITDAVNNLK